MPTTDAPEFLTPRETAVYLRLSLSRIYQMLTAGEIPAARFGGLWRIPRTELDRLIAERAHRPPAA